MAMCKRCIRTGVNDVPGPNTLSNRSRPRRRPRYRLCWPRIGCKKGRNQERRQRSASFAHIQRSRGRERIEEVGAGDDPSSPGSDGASPYRAGVGPIPLRSGGASPCHHCRSQGVPAGDVAPTGLPDPLGTESGIGGTKAVSIILEYSIETLPARSILVALAGSAYV